MLQIYNSLLSTIAINQSVNGEDHESILCILAFKIFRLKPPRGTPYTLLGGFFNFELTQNGYELLGDQTAKNIAQPVGAYRVLIEQILTVAGKPKAEKPTPVRRMPILVGVVVVFALVVVIPYYEITLELYAVPLTLSDS